MSLRFKTVPQNSHIPRQALPTMQARKFGGMNPTITNQICGLWDVLSTKCAQGDLPSKEKT